MPVNVFFMVHEALIPAKGKVLKSLLPNNVICKKCHIRIDVLHILYRLCHQKVNIIPIIGKADGISKTELQNFKDRIMSELVGNGVQIYQFPADDETFSEINIIMNVSK